jgi:HSP20 family molecular chaperone IbpA
MNRKIIFPIVITAALLCPPVLAQDKGQEAELKQQIQALNDRINQLEKQLASKQTQAASGQAGLSPAIYMQQSWDPFAELDLMHRMADAFNPRVDIKESPKEYTITMDIPGMNKDNINVKVEEHNLIVSGERSTENEESQPGKFFRQERSFGNFMRVVALPEDAKEDAVDAAYNNGVLTIKVGRTANPKPAAQKIKVK